MSGSSDSDCAAHFSGAEGWRCLFAPVRVVHWPLTARNLFLFLLQYNFEFIESPIFVLNSLYDTAQLDGILMLDCLPPDCDDQQMKFFDNFRDVSHVALAN